MALLHSPVGVPVIETSNDSFDVASLNRVFYVSWTSFCDACDGASCHESHLCHHLLNAHLCSHRVCGVYGACAYDCFCDDVDCYSAVYPPGRQSLIGQWLEALPASIAKSFLDYLP